MVECIWEMEVRTEGEMEGVLRGVAWVEGWFDGVVGEIWDEVRRVRREMVVTDGLNHEMSGGLTVDEAYGVRDERGRVAGWYV